MFDHTTAPIINQLAMEYALFDSWYCSIPGPTDPNRQFAMSGTSLGIIENYNGTLYEQQSYFDYLTENGKSISGYFQNDLWMLGTFKVLIHSLTLLPTYSSHFYSRIF
jgi:phospholipase C